MTREVPFDAEATCDRCGVKGAFDFMGDCICLECVKKVIPVTVSWTSGDTVEASEITLSKFNAARRKLELWDEMVKMLEHASGVLWGTDCVHTSQQINELLARIKEIDNAD